MASSSTAFTATSRTTTNGSLAGVVKAKRLSLRSTTRAVTRTHPIELRFRADLPEKTLREIRKKYSEWLLPEQGDDELFAWNSTELSREISAQMTIGARIYGLRDAHGWTQSLLGEKLGGVSAARISDWERDRRSVSKDVAKQLSALFHVPVERFL